MKKFDCKIEEISIPIKMLMDKISMKELFLSPRLNYPKTFWNASQMSQYIESILLDFPLYPFCFSLEQEKYWEIFDGYQRIKALKDYILLLDHDEQFKLQKIDLLSDLEGMTFSELPVVYKRKLLERHCKVFIVRYAEPDEIKDMLLKKFRKVH